MARGVLLPPRGHVVFGFPPACLRRAGRSDRRRNLAGSGGAGCHGRGPTALDCAGATRATRTTWAAEAVRMHHHRVMLVVVAAVVAAAVAEDEAGEEDDRNDEHDPGDGRDPGREFKDPGGPVWRRLSRDGR